MKNFFNERKIILMILFLFGFIYRLIDHAPNFTPIMAISLFTGFYFKDKRIILLPIMIMLLSDLFLGFYNFGIMISVYSCLALAVILGSAVIKKNTLKNIILGSLAGSVLFFAVTNFSVWFFGGWYEHSLAGLAKCYLMAIPFFRNTMLGDLFFTGFIFSAYELCLLFKLSWEKKLVKHNN